MNEILLNILSTVVTMVLLPLIALAGERLIAWINVKVKDANAKRQLTVATTIVTNAVRLVSQTYVDSLKASGNFNEDSQKIALTKAKDAALAQMNEEVRSYITTNYGNLDNWLIAQIEATINILKVEK